MRYNKETLDKAIHSLTASVSMEADIREVLERFKHYKQVNSRFTDAVREKGYWAYIVKDNYSTKLVVSCNQHNIDIADRADFTIYVSEIMQRRPITWDLIESELVKHAFKERLDQALACKACFEAEREQFKKLCDHIDNLDFKCFQLYAVKRDLRGLLDYANK